MFEWPSKYQPGEVEVPAFSSESYPTLVAIAGARVSSQPGLDGIDLGGVMAGEENERPAMGFWHGLVDGQSTESDTIIHALMQAQQDGTANPYPERLLKNVNAFSGYTEGHYEGHAAWNQWPWKLHRIQNGDDVTLELYHLVDDPMETNNLATRETGRVNAMRTELEAWQASVFASAAGQDYVPGSY
jgi:arylsulfatase A-like enzyme